MGLFDNLKNVLGGKKDNSIGAATKAPSQVLKENGIDPSGLKFAFGADGTVTVTGEVQRESDKARVKQVLLGIPGVKQVKQELSLATARPAAKSSDEAPAASPAPANTPAAPAAAAEPKAAASASYTVQAGDTLWKISKQFYGDGAQYMKIFEANKGLLKNPDHIFPGQELVIPEKSA